MFEWLSDDVHIFCHIGGRCGTSYTGLYDCSHYDKTTHECKKRYGCKQCCVIKPRKYLRFVYLGHSPFEYLEDFLTLDYLDNCIYDTGEPKDLNGILTKKQYKFIVTKAKLRARKIWDKYPKEKFWSRIVLSDDYNKHAEEMREKIRMASKNT